MKYGIIVNPAAGATGIPQKKRILEDVAEILGRDCVIDGFDTTSSGELCACAQELIKKADILVVAGGDGTFIDILNTVDKETVLSYIPLGTGNALRFALHMPSSIRSISRMIRDGKERRLDVISCNGGVKCLFASVGLDGDILKKREDLVRKGMSGFKAYTAATFSTVLGGYARHDMRMSADSAPEISIPRVATFIVTKIPYYGYGLKVVPKARMDDGVLHCTYINTHYLCVITALVTACLGGNIMGSYVTARNIKLSTSAKACLQINGMMCREDTSFCFSVLPGYLKMRY